MTKKRKVEDSELEQVSGGVMDQPAADQQFDEAGSGSDSGFVTQDSHDLSNDMILTETDREE